MLHVGKIKALYPIPSKFTENKNTKNGKEKGESSTLTKTRK